MNLQRRAMLLGGGAVAASAALGAGMKLRAAPLASGGPSAAQAAAAPLTHQPVLAAPAVQTRAATDVRRLFLQNLHTGETAKAVYWEGGRYIEDGLAEGRRVLRDWRNGQQHEMDPQLFDIFHELGARLEANGPFQIISGYRSPATNAALHARSSGVAKRSLHVDGKATDIRVQGVELARVRKAALDVGRGGVGYYPVSNFVHVDTGRVRQWSGA